MLRSSLLFFLWLTAFPVLAGEVVSGAPSTTFSDDAKSLVVTKAIPISGDKSLQGWWRRVNVRCVSAIQQKGNTRDPIQQKDSYDNSVSTEDSKQTNQLHIFPVNSYEQIFDAPNCKACKIKGGYVEVSNNPLTLSWTQTTKDSRLQDNNGVPWARGIRPGASRGSYFKQGDYLLEMHPLMSCEKDGKPGTIEDVWSPLEMN